MRITSTPPMSGHHISIADEDGQWLCSATSDDHGNWPVEVTPALPSGYSLMRIVSDSATGAENSLALIADGILARIKPPGDKQAAETLFNLVTAIRTVCGQSQQELLMEVVNGKKDVDDLPAKG